ncbi:MAG TPA: ABC transporter permease, partial [Kiritimatiellia bacterium]|nr:ABC transporter permease [Kiritimatiellia bacterium]
WDIGVLRAIGFTRWAIVRAVIAEGLLIGLVACLLSLGFGILAGWCGAGLSQYVSFFAGLHLELILEWRPILAGLGAALLLCALAAVGPALSIARTEPLTLLQQGRGSF